jgi:hypothetical protein
MSNTSEIEARVLAAADPRSPSYGAWLTRDEVNALAAPPAEMREVVRAWVTSTGARCVDFPTSLRCVATAGAVNALLATQLSAFTQCVYGAGLVRGRGAERRPALCLRTTAAFLQGRASWRASRWHSGARVHPLLLPPH